MDDTSLIKETRDNGVDAKKKKGKKIWEIRRRSKKELYVISKRWMNEK